MIFFQFEITLGETTGFGEVWEEQDVLDFLDSEVCSKSRFYKKRKIFNFHIDSNLDDLKECKTTHYLKHLQESYLRVVDMRELLLLHSRYEFESGLTPYISIKRKSKLSSSVGMTEEEKAHIKSHKLIFMQEALKMQELL